MRMLFLLTPLLAGCGEVARAQEKPAEEQPAEDQVSFPDPIDELKRVPTSDTQRVVFVQGEVLAGQERQVAQTESDLIYALKSLDWLSCRQEADAKQQDPASCGPEPRAPAPIPIEVPQVYLAADPVEHIDPTEAMAEQPEAMAAEGDTPDTQKEGVEPDPPRNPTKQQPTKD